MSIIEIINKKKLKEELTKQEIEFVINGYLNGDIKDYQISSLLMAITINGMTDKETIFLTDSMIDYKKVFDLKQIDEVIVDKQSTGTLGDKITLILAPLLASLDIKVGKISGNNLGYTGGTIDKLESINGFNSKLTEKEYIKQINKINIAVANQIDEIVPANKKLYELRSLTGTFNSIPLLAASIMSKKIASSANIVIIDINIGKGNFIETKEEAKRLANLMIKIGKHYKKLVICLITNMYEPFGHAIGNCLEVEEAINTLKGNGANDVLEMVITIGSIIVGALKKISNTDAKDLLFKQLNNGEAHKKFEEFITAQSGNLKELNISKKVFCIKSDKTGYINRIDILKLGEILKQIGGCKTSFEDKIYNDVGFLLMKKVGDHVEKEEDIIKVYLRDKDICVSQILDCFEIDKELEKKQDLILNIIK